MEARITTRKDVETLLADLESRKNNIKAKDEIARIHYSALFSLFSMYLQVMKQNGTDYLILDVPTSMLNLIFGRVKTKRKVKK
jgi:hypothetical protein